jgi:hypothetical protein
VTGGKVKASLLVGERFGEGFFRSREKSGRGCRGDSILNFEF